MTRDERIAHQKRGRALAERSRKIVFELAAAFGDDSRADLLGLAKLEHDAKVFREEYEEWWRKN